MSETIVPRSAGPISGVTVAGAGGPISGVVRPALLVSPDQAYWHQRIAPLATRRGVLRRSVANSCIVCRQPVMRDSCDAGNGESPGNDFDLSRWTRR